VQEVIFTFNFVSLKYFRRVFFDIAVEGQPFVSAVESLSKAISTFLHLCFVAHLEYPPVRIV
jgi:hypothetical protein